MNVKVTYGMNCYYEEKNPIYVASSINTTIHDVFIKIIGVIFWSAAFWETDFCLKTNCNFDRPK